MADPERRVQSSIGRLQSLVRQYCPQALAHVHRYDREPPIEAYQGELRERWGA